MSFESLKASAYALLEEIAGTPTDRHVLHERLQETIREMWAMGQTPPNDLVELEEWLARDLSARTAGQAHAPLPDSVRRRVRDRRPGGDRPDDGRPDRDRGRD
ncbi:hypothetical protein GE300_09785 [Rhodobacteraceae bacterium 2CG4]|uniref:Uncharacterized protein n=1 Tax=Halovulum marinum TaxID=2662447 RepID=A0A6L5Z049_9RHOB|nr:hypothetical protein [Halovulum marinum]MSU89897.1 hypothetical protein [Halovulum marinum]